MFTFLTKAKTKRIALNIFKKLRYYFYRFLYYLALYKKHTMTHLTKGEKAPQFEAKIEDGSLISLKDFAGKKKILFFYPKDSTPGCTANACNFRDNYGELTKQGFVVIGASIQGEKSHMKFIAKNDLPFHLIVDEDKKLHETYGVWGQKKTFGKEYMGTLRTTFVIDENDELIEVITKVKTKDATQQILELLK